MVCQSSTFPFKFCDMEQFFQVNEQPPASFAGYPIRIVSAVDLRKACCRYCLDSLRSCLSYFHPHAFLLYSEITI